MHALYLGSDGQWHCEQHDFRGDLHDAIGHAVQNQFVVRPSQDKE